MGRTEGESFVSDYPLGSMPKETTLRDNERASNQGDLFEDNSFTTELSRIRRWYAWITFNADADGNLSHLAIGLPKARENDWLDLVSILRGKIEGAVGPHEERRPPEPHEVMKLREEFRELQKKSPKKHEKKE